MAETNGIMEIDGRRTALTIAKAVAVALVVGLFSAFYCWSFWDPAGAMKHVPVGIVNLDEGAVANGEDVNLGADITRHAVEGDAANFVELDADALDEGIENSGCLLAFEIPERFSRDVMSGTDGVPKVADLEVYKNVRYNYIFSQFSSSVEKEFENEIDAAIVNAYVGGAYAGLERARDGFEDASDGAERLASGGDGLSIGLSSLEEGAGSAAEGAGSVASGAHDLAEGASVLDAGAQSLADGTEYLADSTQTMPGKTYRLASGASSAAEGVADAAEGAASLSDTARSVQDSRRYPMGLKAACSGSTRRSRVSPRFPRSWKRGLRLRMRWRTGLFRLGNAIGPPSRPRNRRRGRTMAGRLTNGSASGMPPSSRSPTVRLRCRSGFRRPRATPPQVRAF